MKFLYRYVLIPVLLIVFFTLVYLNYREVKRQTLKQYNSEQKLIAESASKGISDYINNCKSDLTFLSGFRGVINLDENGKELIREYYQNNSAQIEAITRVNEQGVILDTYPENLNTVGKNISDQTHVKEFIEIQKEIISDVFMSVQGYPAIAIHVPVFEENTFKGSLAILIPIDKIGERYLKSLEISKKGYALLLSKNNIEIYSPFNENIGKSINEVSKNTATVKQLVEQINEENYGSLKCFLNQSNSFDAVEDYVFFYRVPLGNTYWTILISNPYSNILKTIAGFRNRYLLLSIVLFTILLIYFYSFTKARSIIKEESKRIIAEKALFESEEKYRTLFDTVQIGIFRTKVDGSEILDLNEHFLKIFGYSKEEVYGQPTILHWANPDERDELIQILKKDGHVENFECVLLNKKGEKLICITSLQINKEHGILEGSLFDITDRKKIEQEIKKLNEELDQKVKERTSELETKVAEQNRLNKLFVDRELRMIELKEKIEILENKIKRNYN